MINKIRLVRKIKAASVSTNWLEKGIENNSNLKTKNIQEAMIPVVMYGIMGVIEKNLGLVRSNNNFNLSKYPNNNELMPKAPRIKE
ncbi:hypothetical protein MHH29_09985 [Bacillus sp. FSL K6-0046]|uniref:hypothetical protein n=1 Tax=Bacillus sp. FSL K6-0046 TaxID=2921409 RepID=UPI00315A3980